MQPLQNSGLRTESITDIVTNVQKNMRSSPVTADEDFVSFDCVSMYDFLTVELGIYCIGLRAMELQQKSGRVFNLSALEQAIRICYEEGVCYKDKMFKQKSGAPTGHPISSAMQNVIMSTYETEIYAKYITSKAISLYDRWVDDTLVRVKSGVYDTILLELNEFDPSGGLKFTIEKPTPSADAAWKNLDFLDFSIRWAVDSELPVNFNTRVYRKATAAKTVKPWADYGPASWKVGTLVWFLRRAVSHSSDHHMMHEEFQFLKAQFTRAGYPISLIDTKINQTQTHMLGYGQVKKDSEEQLSNTWIVLHLPWSGEAADKG